MATVIFGLTAACGGSEPAAAPSGGGPQPSGGQPAPTQPGSATATTAPSRPGGGAIAPGEPVPGGPWQSVDPCTLLTAVELKPFLAATPVTPSREDAGGKRTCAWGDGEFRSVRVTLWQPASPAEVTTGAKRQVAVRGRQVQVVDESAYTCVLQTGEQRGAVALQAVSMDKESLCPDAVRAFQYILVKLG